MTSGGGQRVNFVQFICIYTLSLSVCAVVLIKVLCLFQIRYFTNEIIAELMKYLQG